MTNNSEPQPGDVQEVAALVARVRLGRRTQPAYVGTWEDVERAMVMLESIASTLTANAERLATLEAKTRVAMGVGDGNGKLFVHGDYDSIKACQAIVDRAAANAAQIERLKGEVQRCRLLHEPWRLEPPKPLMP